MTSGEFTYTFDPSTMICWLAKLDEESPLTKLTYERQSPSKWLYRVEYSIQSVTEDDSDLVNFLERVYERYIGALVVK
jgi:hypothetical protein